MRCNRLMAGLIGFALWTGQAFAQTASTLVPRIGETAQEFEARQRGIKLTPTLLRHCDALLPIGADTSSWIQPLTAARPAWWLIRAPAWWRSPMRMPSGLGARLSPQDFTVRMSTANGMVEGAPFRISEVRIGDLAVEDVEAVVLPKGRLEVSLLGMSFLKRLGGFDISQGRLNLRK